MDKFKYPIGRFNYKKDWAPVDIYAWVKDITLLPANLANELDQLTPEQLDQSYKPNGWSARQITHHLADSHMNAYIRFKKALVEDNPTISTYDHERWASAGDYSLPTEIPVQLLSGLHRKWGKLLNSMSKNDFLRTFHHPEEGQLTLAYLLQMYVWHGKHHTAHIRLIVEQTL